MKRDRHTARYRAYMYGCVASLRAWAHWETRRITSSAHSCRICPSVMSKYVIGVLRVVGVVGIVRSVASVALIWSVGSERFVFSLEGSILTTIGVLQYISSQSNTVNHKIECRTAHGEKCQLGMHGWSKWPPLRNCPSCFLCRTHHHTFHSRRRDHHQRFSPASV